MATNQGPIKNNVNFALAQLIIAGRGVDSIPPAGSVGRGLNTGGETLPTLIAF